MKQRNVKIKKIQKRLGEIESLLFKPQEKHFFQSTQKPAGALKLFFFEHEKNGFHPHLFHYHRLALYACTALVTKLIILVTVFSLPLSAWTASSDPGMETEKIFLELNRERTEHGLAELILRPELSQSAFVKAKIAESGAEAGSRTLSSFKLSASYESYANIVVADARDPQSAHEALIKELIGEGILLDSRMNEVGIGIFKKETLDMEKKYSASVMLAQRKKISSDQPVINTDYTQDIPSGTEAIQTPGLSEEADTGPVPAEPVINGGEISTTTNKDFIKLRISALGAQKLMLYVDELEYQLFSRPVGTDFTSSSEYEDTVELADGVHSILVKAITGGIEQYSKPYLIAVDTIAPRMSRTQSETRLTKTPVSTTVSVSARFDSGIAFASARFGETEFALKQNPHDANLWEGSFELNSADMDTDDSGRVWISAEDQAGNRAVFRLENKDTKAGLIGAVKSYLSLKKEKSPLAPLIFAGNILYFAGSGIFLITLFLYLYIGPKRRKATVGLSVMGLVVLISACFFF